MTTLSISNEEAGALASLIGTDRFPGLVLPDVDDDARAAALRALVARGLVALADDGATATLADSAAQVIGRLVHASSVFVGLADGGWPCAVWFIGDEGVVEQRMTTPGILDHAVIDHAEARRRVLRTMGLADRSRVDAQPMEVTVDELDDVLERQTGPAPIGAVRGLRVIEGRVVRGSVADAAKVVWLDAGDDGLWIVTPAQRPEDEATTLRLAPSSGDAIMATLSGYFVAAS